MANECKTVTSDAEVLDPLYKKQTKDVAEMRASLLAFNSGDNTSARQAIQKITAMRFYHQIARIIRYTEMMDKLEDKLYASIDRTLDDMEDTDPTTVVKLLAIQEKLQKSMIESQKLLEPYLDLESLTFVEMPQSEEDKPFNALLLEQESRDKVRSSAQAILAALESGESPGASPEEV